MGICVLHVPSAVHAFHVEGLCAAGGGGRDAGEAASEPSGRPLDHQKDDYVTKRRQCKDINLETGVITFANGTTAQHDLIVGADGIGSAVRSIIGLKPEKKPADSSCLHANVRTEDAVRLGLVDYSQHSALEYWGGQDNSWDKIVLSPCNGGSLLSYYCFFPREKGDFTNHTWGGADRPVEELLAPYPELDKQVRAHLAIGQEIRPWRLWVHQPYPYLVRNMVCLLGDAGHPVRFPRFRSGCSRLIRVDDAAPEPGCLHGYRRCRCTGYPLQPGLF